MAYSLSGRATEFCSCSTPCPCAFNQEPDNGRCQGIIFMDFDQGELDGVSLAGTKAVLASSFGPRAWTAGNLTAALIVDSNASQEQRDALSRILAGQEGGDAAGIAALISDFKGVLEAPIEGSSSEDKVSFKAGDLAEGSGSALRTLDGSEPIRIPNPAYLMTNIIAGRADKVRIGVSGLEYDGPGTGFWTGPVTLNG
jgi:hypothetical protein